MVNALSVLPLKPLSQQEIYHPIPPTLPSPPIKRSSLSKSRTSSIHRDIILSGIKATPYTSSSASTNAFSTSATNSGITSESSNQKASSQSSITLNTQVTFPLTTAPITSTSEQQLPTANTQSLDELLMSFDFGMMEPVDFDQYLVDADLGEQGKLPWLPKSYVADDAAQSPMSIGGTPKSTESEQSQALDVDDGNFFDLPQTFAHRPEDMYDASVSGQILASDPTMMSAFGLDFSAMTGLGNDAASQLGLSNVIEKYEPVSTVQAVIQSVDLNQMFAGIDWSVLQTGIPLALAAPFTSVDQFASPAQPQLGCVSPSLLVSPGTTPPGSSRPSLKRMLTDETDEGDAQVPKKPRGRPPKPNAEKRPYRRQSKTSTSVPALAAAAISGTPVLAAVPIEDDSDDELASGSKKASTARPKSVVPDKYLKDGTASKILGMPVEQINSYPTFTELLKHVSEPLKSGATEFGFRIAENRDKAKDAAKKSRDEKRSKIETLEKAKAELEVQILKMQVFLSGLAKQGVIGEGEVAVFM